MNGAITKFRYKMSLWRSDSPEDEQQGMGLSCCTENLSHKSAKNYKLRVGAPKRENHPFRCLGEWRSINEPLHSWTTAGITWVTHFKLSRCFCDSPTRPTLNNFYKPLVTFTVTQSGLGLPPSSTSFCSQCEKRCWNNCTEAADSAENPNRLTNYS